MKQRYSILAVTILVGAALHLNASSVLPLSAPELVQTSAAVFRGKVVGMTCFKDDEGLIYTATSLRADEPLKGTFPPIVLLVHRGGRVGNEDEYCGLSPRFVSGGEYLLFVVRSPDGRLQCTQGAASAIRLERGGAEFKPPGQTLLDEIRALTGGGKLPGDDVTDQVGSAIISPKAASGMLGGVAARFLQPDHGEPIPVLIDADTLPTGITLTQATNAVQQALNAWVAVTSLKFKLEGIQSFGAGADQITTSDGKIRIQLHDNYNRINTSGVLGIGGRSAITSPLSVGWDLGGNVAGNEFWKSTRGYVILEAGSTMLQTLTTFTEVLCHEIGHSLNLAHSSEDFSETDPVLRQAMMYYMAHADGRGAALGAYDPPIIEQVYPANTPPYCFDRFMDITSGSPPPSVAGINEVQLRGYDLQSTTLTLATSNPSDLNGSFSVAGNVISFTPSANYQTTRIDPSSSSYWDVLYARFSDGTNASPYVKIRVLSMSSDSSPSDGLPNNWMTAYFGHTAPGAGDQSRATDDADGDLLNNLREYIAGMNPKDSNSVQRILSLNNGTLQFQAKPYEVYEVLGSTNLTTWDLVTVAIPTNASAAVLTGLPTTNVTAVISNLPTTGDQMFFRISKVP